MYRVVVRGSVLQYVGPLRLPGSIRDEESHLVGFPVGMGDVMGTTVPQYVLLEG